MRADNDAASDGHPPANREVSLVRRQFGEGFRFLVAQASQTPPRAIGTACIFCVSRNASRSKYAANGSGRSIA